LLTRSDFLTEVGIVESTLSRWIREGVIQPQRELRDGHWVQLFSKQDASLARAVGSLLSQHRGQLRLSDAVAAVRREVELPEDAHNPRNPLVTLADDERSQEIRLEMLKLELRQLELERELAQRARARKTLTKPSSTRGRSQR